ncbi:hypothetical protein Hanom_Chr10g00909691 [Helianthus anomalus]
MKINTKINKVLVFPARIIKTAISSSRLQLKNKANRTVIASCNIWENVGIMDIFCN